MMNIGNREFDVKHHTYVMGILNVTPDSFSDGGKFCLPEQALTHAEQMIREGADIIDIGGESTRPDYVKVSAEEEMERILPVIRKLKNTFDIPVSVDTYKASVAKAALQEGADLVNDISCLKDEGMAKLIAESGCAYCLMHNREGKLSEEAYMQEFIADLKDAADRLWTAGVQKSQVMIDPGIGFAKSYQQNLQIMKRLDELNCFELPVLLGTSRKSVIGLTLDLPVNDRLEGTLATTVYGVMKHCAFVRVHDIKENVRVIKMIEKILEA